MRRVRRVPPWILLLLAGAIALALVLLLVARPEPAEQKAEAERTSNSNDAALELQVTAAGKPIARAHVSVSGRCEAQTQGDGIARMLACPTGKRRVLVEAAGFARALHPVQLKAGNNTLAITLQPGWRLQGRVRDDDGNAVGAAVVTIQREAAEGAADAGAAAARDLALDTWTVRAAEDGTFECDTLPPGVVSVQAARAPYEAVTLPQISVPAPAPVEIVLQRMAALRGRVLVPPGTSVAGSAVTLAGSGVWPARTERTEASGEFRFAAVPPGIYELRAEHGELISAPLEGVSIESGQEISVELALNAGAVLSGTVTEAASGRPLPGARLRVHEDALTATVKETASAPKTGRFEVRGLRRLPHRVTVELGGYVALETVWWPDSAAELSLALLRSARVRGRVEDSQGEPIADAELEVLGKIITGDALRITGVTRLNRAPRAADGGAVRLGVPAAGDNLGVIPGAVPPIPLTPRPPGADVSPSGVFLTDAAGNFDLEGIPPGEFRIWARRSGFVPATSSSVTLWPASVREGLKIVMTRGGKIEGRVLDPHKQPVSQVRITLTAGGETLRSTLSDEAGEFEFQAVQGRYRVMALPFGAPSTQIDGDLAGTLTKRVELILESTADRLDGRVLDTAGFPVSHARIKLETRRSRGGLSTTVLSKQDGTFEFNGLPPPPYSVSVDHPEFAPGEETSVSSTERPLTLTLEAGSNLAGFVVDATTRDPLAGARVSLAKPGTGVGLVAAADSGAAQAARGAPAPALEAVQTRTDDDGQFEFTHVSEGPYQLTVEAAGHVVQSRRISLQAQRHDRAAPDEEFQLQASGSLSGTLVDRLGVPVWNAEVSAGDSPDWSRAVRTDHSGRFIVKGLLPGAAATRLTARKGGLRALGYVRVHEGVDTPGAVLRFEGVAPTDPEPEISEAARAGLRSTEPPQQAVTASEAPEPAGVAAPAPVTEASGADDAPADPPSEAPAASAERAPHTPLAFGRRGDLVIVERVAPGSQADTIGLRSGDVVTAINGELVRSPAQARGMLGMPTGGGFVIDVRREGQLLRLRQNPRR